MVQVLVVEDDVATARSMEALLRAEGFSVELAHDGSAALARFSALEPDLVLLDVGLPRLSGLDVCTRLRRISKVPIIFVSGRASEADRVVGLELGADDYVAKPFSAVELCARIRAVLRRRRPQLTSVPGRVDDGRPERDRARTRQARPPVPARP